MPCGHSRAFFFEKQGGYSNEETKETLTKVAEYADQNKLQLKKRMAGNCAAALILLLFCTVLDVTNGFIAERPFNSLMGFTLGLTMAILFMNILYLTGKLEVFQNWKKKLFHKN